MSDAERDKWNEASGASSITSRRGSGCEALDPHDPTISRLATQLFQKTSDYLQGEMTAGQEHYNLLEEMNRVTISKYADLRGLAVNLSKTLKEYDEMFETGIKPLLDQIDSMHAQVTQAEERAYRLDAYTKRLKETFEQIIGSANMI